ncbi:ribonucleoside-diphosphate reductase subunit alpha [Ralstonia phage RP13]|nr:ribonucleoside-diphosphate reductase subunit alpha [Ralstonia phage RP13]
MLKTVIKRDGTPAEFNPDTLNKWAEWSAPLGVDWSSVVLGAVRKVNDGCTTEELHQALISECIDQETTAHLKMAGRLFIGDLHKKIFGGHDKIPSLYEMYKSMVSKGFWAVMDYTREEFDYLDTVIDHEADLHATYSEIKQIMDKYAIIDRVDKIPYETPQFMYMRMAMGNMERMPKARRLHDITKAYTFLSKKKINTPSPFNINLGTPKKQYASCCVVTTDDNIPSLAAADHIVYMMTCASAGIGSHHKTRSAGDKVRGGQIIHQGKLPYYKVSQALVMANLQSARGGALTEHYCALDPELDDLSKLKDVETVAQKQVKDIDYSFGYNHEFARRVAKNLSWMLISYGHAPELHHAMYKGDQTEFLELYAKIEKDHSIPKKFVSARQFAIQILTSAYETGRIYEHRTDIMNWHTPFKETIWSSNLCQEIGLVTEGYRSVEDLYKYEYTQGEIGLCNLAAICAGNVKDNEYEEVAYYAALMVDNVIDIMDYPFPQLKYTAQARRSIGIGITNLAHDMAKRGLQYSSPWGKKYMHRLAETHSFYLHKASLRLAKERGVCDWIHKTKYPDGWLPIDTANKQLSEEIGQPLIHNWEGLRKEIVEFGGIRHSVLEAYMPVESSSGASNTTNGLYPIRAHKVVKTSGINKNLFIAPDSEDLFHDYEMAWDIPTFDMIDGYAIFQMFTGQAISADIYIRYSDLKDGMIGTTQLITEFLHRAKRQLKTRYYINSHTGVRPKVRQDSVESVIDDKCASGACTL